MQITRTVSLTAQALRDPSEKTTDKAALQAIAQAAVEVELFTIPLYMTSLYSIHGMHQITSAGNAFYEGRLWPGLAPVAHPTTANEQAFNIVFSVFIQEMLHLQLAANMATAIGLTPNFTSSALQNADHGWTCYSPTSSTIPHIVDLKDTTTFAGVAVDVAALSREQLQLFLAIEQPADDARRDIRKDKLWKYFPKAPFADWQAGQPLPPFGTIGWMYQCYFDYLNLKYSDGSSLWDEVYNPSGQQNDLFNNFGAGHPMREFMGFESTVALTYKDIAFAQMGAMMDAITDQGEGSVLKERARLLQLNLLAVEDRYRPSMPALKSDYPSYSDTGGLEPSAAASARGDNDGKDHYERFQEVLGMIDQVVTWPAFLAKHGPWIGEDLEVPGHPPPPNPKIPTTVEIASALNELAHPAPGAPDYLKLLSQAAVGSIAGVTTVLDKFWNAQAQASAPVSFPFPSMTGSGDRMAICWAVFGKGPDLSVGLDPPVANTLYHSCQGIDYAPPAGEAGTNNCAPVTVFHSCRGSNGCHAQGGCGFVQPTTGGGNCSSGGGGGGGGGCGALAGSYIGMKAGGGCNPFAGAAYSAPGDNKCTSFGGCAVPISASQLFPKQGHMQLFGFSKDSSGAWTSTPAGEILFNVGDNVHDVAWTAYKTVMKLGDDPPAPKANPLRLAFPPST